MGNEKERTKGQRNVSPGKEGSRNIPAFTLKLGRGQILRRSWGGEQKGELQRSSKTVFCRKGRVDKEQKGKKTWKDRRVVEVFLLFHKRGGVARERGSNRGSNRELDSCFFSGVFGGKKGSAHVFLGRGGGGGKRDGGDEKAKEFGEMARGLKKKKSQKVKYCLGKKEKKATAEY